MFVYLIADLQSARQLMMIGADEGEIRAKGERERKRERERVSSESGTTWWWWW